MRLNPTAQPTGYLYYIPCGADLAVDRNLHKEIVDNEPRLFGAADPSDCTTNVQSMGNGNFKKVATPGC